MTSRTKRFTAAIGLAAVGAMLLVATVRPHAQGAASDFLPEPEPLAIQVIPPIPTALTVYLWAYFLHEFRMTAIQAFNAEMEERQRLEVMAAALENARRNMQGGIVRLKALLAPFPVGMSVDTHVFGEAWGRGKLQRDLEAWERLNPRFRFFKSEQCAKRPVQGMQPDLEKLYCDSYVFTKEKMVRAWTERITPCLNHLQNEWNRLRPSINKPNSAAPPVVVARSIQRILIGEAAVNAPVELDGVTADPAKMDQVVELFTQAPAARVEALCKQGWNPGPGVPGAGKPGRGPLTFVNLMAAALEHQIVKASAEGKTTHTEIKIDIDNRTADGSAPMSFEVYVKKKDEDGVSIEGTPLMVHPVKIAEAYQIEPRGARPDGTQGHGWVSVSPGDQVWIRAMTNGRRRDFVKFETIGRRVLNPSAPPAEQKLAESQLLLLPDAMPRNYYQLMFRTRPPNLLVSKWSVEDEGYGWTDNKGPWGEVGGLKQDTSTARMRDLRFGVVTVKNDVIKLTVPDLTRLTANGTQPAKLEELTVVATGSTKWLREGPRTLLAKEVREGRETEDAKGTLVIRVQTW